VILMNEHLRKALEGADPLGPEGIEPMEGLENEPSLWNDTVVSPGEWFSQLQDELDQAKAALRKIAASADNAQRMPYKAQASVLRHVGGIANAALSNLDAH
jgi:hypothetical protein